MIKRNQAVLNRINAFIDLLLVIVSYIFSTWIRFYILDGRQDNMALSRRMIGASALYAVGLVVVLALLGFYSTTRRRRLSWRIRCWRALNRPAPNTPPA